MNQTIFKSPLERPSSDNTESDRSFPPSKRLCNSSSTSKVSSSSSNVEQISNGEQKITNGCQLCGRIETRLLQINCPSLHHFCVNCIFSGTQDHIQVRFEMTFRELRNSLDEILVLEQHSTKMSRYRLRICT